MKLIQLASKTRPAFLQAVEDHGSFFMVRLKGDLDTRALEGNHDKMTAVIEEHGLYTRSVLCDFGEVTDSDTATVAALIERFAEFRKAASGRKLIFFNIRGELKEIFEITHLAEIFTICENEQQALEALK